MSTVTMDEKYKIGSSFIIKKEQLDRILYFSFSLKLRCWKAIHLINLNENLTLCMQRENCRVYVTFIPMKNFSDDIFRIKIVKHDINDTWKYRQNDLMIPITHVIRRQLMFGKTSSRPGTDSMREELRVVWCFTGCYRRSFSLLLGEFTVDRNSKLISVKFQSLSVGKWSFSFLVINNRI